MSDPVQGISVVPADGTVRVLPHVPHPEARRSSSPSDHAAYLTPAADPANLGQYVLGIIKTPCPSCGNTTLFVGMGGHLTCSLIGCKSPIVAEAINELKGRLSAIGDLASGQVPDVGIRAVPLGGAARE